MWMVMVMMSLIRTQKPETVVKWSRAGLVEVRCFGFLRSGEMGRERGKGGSSFEMSVC